MKKKIVLSLLVLVSLFMITGCGDKESQSNSGNNGKVMRDVVNTYLKNNDDDKYFKPATDDYLYYIKKSDYTIAINLISFDEYGNIVQNINREEYTSLAESDYSSFIPNEFQTVSSDKKVMYDDKLKQSATSDKKAISEKFDIIYSYTKYANKESNEELHMSKGLIEKDTKFYNNDSNSIIDSLISFASGFDKDYLIQINKNKVSKDPLYIDYRGSQVLNHGAFSYYHADITFYDNDGNVTKEYNAYVFDDESMIEAFKYSQGSHFDYDAGKYVIDEKVFANLKFKTKNNIFYQVNDSEDLKNEYGTKKWDDLLYGKSESFYVYFSIPNLTSSQIQKFYKTK